MFWHMAGLSAASPVETILDKENFTLGELLDEDEIIQECKALNGRLINFLREKQQVKQLLLYIVEETSQDSEKERAFKLPFIACEIFTCEIDIIFKTLVEDEELMDTLFSFLNHEHPHSTLLAGYFSKVVICLLLQKTTHLMNYIQAHLDIIGKLIDLIGITSIMEVLIRLIGVDEHIYADQPDSIQWLDNMNVLEMIVDKFSSSDCPEVHANAAETLCAITRHPSGLASKISSSSFIGRLFRHALEDSRPKSVLVNLLSVCISLLDPKRITSGMYYMYNRQMTQESSISANPETIESMLENLGDLLKLLDLSSDDHILLTTYGKLQPPLGKHRLKIIEFISVLVTVRSEALEKEFVRLGAVRCVFELFFEYPYNNFLHHHAEQIFHSCLDSKNAQFVEHVLCDCDLVGKILEVEQNLTLGVDVNKTTVPAQGSSPHRVGNIGHLTRIANKLVQLGNSNCEIQKHLQENSAWVDWQTNVLLKRNALENVFQWQCGRPTSLHTRTRDSDDDDYQDRDYDVAALANDLSQAFQYDIYSNDMNEAHCSLERDDEDVYFDDESAEVVISSLRLGNEPERGSLFTNSNWFAFEDERMAEDHSTDSGASSSLEIEGCKVFDEGANVGSIIEEDEDFVDTADSEPPELKPTFDDKLNGKFSGSRETETSGSNRPEWVEWREAPDWVESTHSLPNSDDTPASPHSPTLPNGKLQVDPEDEPTDKEQHKSATSDSAEGQTDKCQGDAGESVHSKKIDPVGDPSQSVTMDDGNTNTAKADSRE